MVEMVKSHIQGINTGYEKELKSNNIEYFNAYASFQDAHTVQVKFGDGSIQTITSKYVLISTGLRPFYPEGLTKSKAPIQSSDDIFSSSSPKKTLIVGGSYIALETASFLAALGFPVTVLVRSIFLRGFDQQMANKIAEILVNKGIRFLKGYIPLDALEKETKGEKVIEVHYQKTDGTGEIKKECFDTVITATGRVPKIEDMNLQAAGIQINQNNQKIIVSPADETNIPGVYALGDIADGRPELAPPAKFAGKLLAERLFNHSVELMDYSNIATAVFTEVEYAFVGLSEEDAIKKYGEQNIEVFHTHFKPLEWNYYFDHEDNCYTKIIVNLSNKNRLLGIHYLGPNAGEIIQGYVVAFKMGITLKDLKKTVGIHPTCAEEIVGLEKTKREDPNAKKSGC
eukprot:TRINITY_DN2052_c0_g3_i1.p1 TRINITY_DN2052_c0_g3~~TRINITY_DN2052_c0_g3_i1.p1  ORF type:complete len:399 (-),score=75.97 TRINITY_DN2052_c0_g3_i1:203-1399(-)